MCILQKTTTKQQQKIIHFNSLFIWNPVTLKARLVADNILKLIFLFFIENKAVFHGSQMIHMKCQFFLSPKC